MLKEKLVKISVLVGAIIGAVVLDLLFVTFIFADANCREFMGLFGWRSMIDISSLTIFGIFGAFLGAIVGLMVSEAMTD